MAKMFISYRRSLNHETAGRIAHQLKLAFGDSNVFQDLDIQPGDDWEEILTDRITKCDVLLVLISKDWSTVEDDNGNKRLFQEDDWVRFEVNLGLKRKECRVIPILLDGAKMPAENQLPNSIRGLTKCQAFHLGTAHSFNDDMNRLIRHLSDQLSQPAHLDQFIDTQAVDSSFNLIVLILILALVIVLALVAVVAISGLGATLNSGL